MLITPTEILYMIILTVALAYIFSGYIRYKPEPSITKEEKIEDMKFAAMIAAPAVILHELGHKFVAMAFGLPASFQIFWGGLGLGVVLRAIQSPFLIVAPGFVVIPRGIPPLVSAIIAFAGPAVNLALWLGSAYYVKTHKRIKHKTLILLLVTKKINMLLFFFNMIPLGPFDGAKVFSGILRAVTGAI